MYDDEALQVLLQIFNKCFDNTTVIARQLEIRLMLDYLYFRF